MQRQPINLTEKLSKFSEHWSPKIIAQMNDYHLKLVRFQGEFVWHDHADTDEVFLVLEGAMTIHFRDGDVAASDPFCGYITEMAVRELGVERVIYGSDVPGRSFASQLAKVHGSELPIEAKRLIFAGNLKRLLGPILREKGVSL